MFPVACCGVLETISPPKEKNPSKIPIFSRPFLLDLPREISLNWMRYLDSIDLIVWLGVIERVKKYHGGEGLKRRKNELLFLVDFILKRKNFFWELVFKAPSYEFDFIKFSKKLQSFSKEQELQEIQWQCFRCIKFLGSRKIIQLDLSFKHLRDGDLFKIRLAKRLQRMDIQYCEMLTNKGIRYLPSNILWLKMPISSPLTEQCIQYLPRGLTRLDLKTKWSMELSSKELRLLPRSLTWLAIALYSKRDLIDKFPANLTYLDLKIIPHSLENFRQVMSFLPQGLQSLCLTDEGGVTSSTLRNLPSTLTSLKLLGGVLKRKALKNLPALLQTLVIKRTYLLRESDICRLPPHLTTFYSFSQESLSDQCIKALPRSLTSLELTGNHHSFTEACLPTLPPSLTYFKAGNQYLIHRNQMKFPKEMT